MRVRTEIFDDVSRKRALAEQQAAAYGDLKRQKLGLDSAALHPPIPPLTAEQNSLAAIFTLTTNPELAAFQASLVPLELAARISVSTLAKIDIQHFDRAVNVSWHESAKEIIPKSSNAR